MEKLKQMRAICDVDFLKSQHCDFLSPSEKEEILNDYADKSALIVGFVKAGNEHAEFVVVYYRAPKSLHVNHVVGNFSRYIRELDIFSQILARWCGYSDVTFCSKRRAIIEKYAPKMGYVPHEINFEFVKAVR